MKKIASLLQENRPLIMGVVNVTPDSFSDGGEFLSLAAALEHANYLQECGADIIDIGGESTRPGAKPISSSEELQRVMPVIERLRYATDVPISVDTSKAVVMEKAIECGATLINDVYSLRKPGTLDVVAGSDVYVCLMHMKGSPHNMQDRPNYKDLLLEVRAFLRDRVADCEKKGISADRLIIDIGFGFGKTPSGNLQLINNLDFFKEIGLPIMVGASRKSTLKKICGDQLGGSLAAALFAVKNGAKILRVHDVKETVAALKVWKSISEERLVDW
jgi:dihydropteroate synthase